MDYIRIGTLKIISYSPCLTLFFSSVIFFSFFILVDCIVDEALSANEVILYNLDINQIYIIIIIGITNIVDGRLVVSKIDIRDATPLIGFEPIMSSFRVEVKIYMTSCHNFTLFLLSRK